MCRLYEKFEEEFKVDLEVVNKYLSKGMTSDAIFITSCRKGYLEVIKYLLTSPELKECVNIHANEDLGFRWACATHNLEIVKYLIFDSKIEKTKSIKKVLIDYREYPEYEELFKQREMMEEILKNTEEKPSKPFKI